MQDTGVPEGALGRAQGRGTLRVADIYPSNRESTGKLYNNVISGV